MRQGKEFQTRCPGADGVDAREFRAEPLGELDAVAAQRFVLDHAIALGDPGDAAHQIEVAAQHGGIAAEPERLGHADAGAMGGPQDRELLAPARG